MEQVRRILPVVGVLYIIGVSGLLRFSQDVKSVQVVGLAGSGFALGVGFAFLVLAFSGRLKQRSDVDAR